MKIHVKGSHNRTLCGMTVVDNTKLIREDEELYETNCKRCLERLIKKNSYLLTCFHKLREKRTRHCKTCEHWTGRDLHSYGKHYQKTGLQSDGKAKCLKLSTPFEENVYEEALNKGLITIVGLDLQSTIDTTEDFGCIYHKEKSANNN